MDTTTKPKDKITVSQPYVYKPVINTETFEQSGWKFISKKSGILPSKELDELADALNLQGIPDVVYGNSSVQIINESKNFVFEVLPQSALSFCNLAKQKDKYKETYDRTSDTETINILPAELKIKQAEHWKNKKVAEGTDIKVLEKISDWTYSSPYKGDARELNPTKAKTGGDVAEDLNKLSINVDSKLYLEKTDEDIPLHNLTPSNPIKWYCEYHLYEDELGDCGLSQAIFRFRVMGDCFFGLVRHYLRIDDVVVRIYDTRIYHDFGKNYILREFSARESTFEELLKKGFKVGADFMTNHRQSDMVYQYLDAKLTFKDKIVFC